MIAGSILLFGVHSNELVLPVGNATPESIARGQVIFTNNCVQCHGRTGEGDGPLAATLTYPVPRYGDHVPFHGEATLFEWITNGIPSDGSPQRMPSFEAALTNEERADVVNFLKATWTFGDYQPAISDDLRPEGGEE